MNHKHNHDNKHTNNNNNNNNNKNTNKIHTNDNIFTAIGELVRQRLVPTTNNSKPTTTVTIESEQTITFTKITTNTGKAKRSVKQTSRKRDPQRAKKRKEKEQKRQTEKIINGILLEVTRKPEGEDGDEQSREPTSTKIDVSNEDESTTIEVQQLLIDHQQFEHGAQETGQIESSQHNDDNTEYSTDADLPPLVGRQRNDASSDDSSSNGSYDNHIDHDHSSIDGSDNERSTVPGLQERNRVDSSSDEDRVPYT